MAEFASKGVAGAGLGTGIAGLAPGVLNSSNNGNGLLGKVNELALTTQAKFGFLDGTIASMMDTLGKITDTIVPMSAICPTPMAKCNAWVAPTNTPATGA